MENPGNLNKVQSSTMPTLFVGGQSCWIRITESRGVKAKTNGPHGVSACKDAENCCTQHHTINNTIFQLVTSMWLFNVKEESKCCYNTCKYVYLHECVHMKAIVNMYIDLASAHLLIQCSLNSLLVSSDTDKLWGRAWDASFVWSMRGFSHLATFSSHFPAVW